MSDYTVTLAGQDITSTVQFHTDTNSNLHSRVNTTQSAAGGGGGSATPQPIVINATLGQGAGTGAQSSGRTAQASFFTTLGPAASAVGAGQLPPPKNLLTPNQSSVESGLSGFSSTEPNLNMVAGAALTQDTTHFWQGAASLRVVTDANCSGSHQEGVIWNPGVALSSGQSITVSFYLWNAGAGGALRFYDVTNGGGPAGIVLPSNTGGWQRVSYSFTQTHATNELRFAIRTSTPNQTFYVDGIQVEVGAQASAWQLGQTASLALVRQGEVIVTDPSGVKIFGGFAGKLSDATIAKQTYTMVDCYDYWQSLARININEILDGITDIAAIRYLLTTYAPWVDQTLLPTFSSGTLLGRVWRNKTLQWALQQIANMTGKQVYVTPNKQIIYVSPTAAQPAPFNLSDTPDYLTTFSHVVDSFVVDDQAIINRVTFYGGKKPTSDFDQDISTQANGNNKTFILAYYPRKSSTGKVQVTVAGVQQVVGYVLSTGAQNTLKSAGGSADVLIDADARTLTFDVAPAAGASVHCIYRYQIPLVVEVTQQDSFNFFGEWFDSTISDETVQDSATAVQRCRVVLLENAYGQTSLSVRCYRGGIQPGQQIHVTNTIKGINATYIVQAVDSSPIAPGVFEYVLTLGAWNWNLVDVLMNLAQSSANADLSQQEDVTPTKVSVATTVATTIGVQVIPITRPMAQYFPGVTGTGVAYPGLFSI